MYKRPVRLLFVHRRGEKTELDAARTALEVASRHSGWIEARRATPEEAAEALAWADLVLTLGECPCPPLPAHAQHRHWPELRQAAIEERLAGVVGGLRLLSRLDEDLGSAP